MLQNCSIVAKKKREYFYLKINNILYVILLYSTSLPWKNVHFNFLMLLIQNYITWKQRIFSAHLKILVFLNRTSVELCLISSCPSHLVTWNFWECIHHKNFISKSNKHYSKKHIHWKCLQALLLLLCFSLLQILCFSKIWMFVATLCLVSLSAPFPMTFTPLSFLCHILIILSISQIFS